MKRTATIERYHIFGTMRHGMRVMYRGRVLHWRKDGHSVYADAADFGAETVSAMRQHAKNQGFTHCRFTGDWAKSAKPQGGKL